MFYYRLISRQRSLLPRHHGHAAALASDEGRSGTRLFQSFTHDGEATSTLQPHCQLSFQTRKVTFLYHLQRTNPTALASDEGRSVLISANQSSDVGGLYVVSQVACGQFGSIDFSACIHREGLAEAESGIYD